MLESNHSHDEAADLLQKDIDKEAAVKDERHWVRLTRLCNQRCKFCLDSWNHNGTYVDSEELYDYIRKGREQGKTRLILSGGEPTIHPDFIKFIRFGRELGYDWIQTVTNGMLFGYPKFGRAAVNAGLNEATFSIHGHNAKIQDGLTGTPGAFESGLQGIRNLQAIGGVVINIDIVVNKQNYRQLPEILDFFLNMGVKEFDLLYIIPFGRGFTDYRKNLFFDLDDDAYPYFQKAFEKSKLPGVFMWTNRLPVNYLEDYEHLIQDPHKLHYEINGGRHNFEGLARWGVPPDCYGERCDHCFLAKICRDTLMPYQKWLKGGSFDRVRMSKPEEGKATEKHLEQINAQEAAYEWYVGATVEDLEETARLYERSEGAEVGERVFELEHGALPFDEDLATISGKIDRWVLDHPSAVEALLVGLDGAEPAIEGELGARVGEFEIILQKDVAKLLLSNLPAVAKYEDRLIFTLRNHEYVSGSRAYDASPDQIKTLAKTATRFRNVPTCVTGAHPEGDDRRVLDTKLVDGKGLLDLDAYVHHFVIEEYYSKSRRCSECIHKDECPGFHINYLRNYGYRACDPVNDGGSALKSAVAAEI